MPEAGTSGGDTPPRNEKPRILVVDDEPDVLDVIRALLAEAGFDVTAYSSATEALHRAKVRRFDAIVLELDMPEMSGLPFHGKVKGFNPTLPARALLVSGYLPTDGARQVL